MTGDPLLLLRLLAAQAALLALLALLARGLGRRLRAEVIAAAIVAPALLLLPWLAGDRILLPNRDYLNSIPGLKGDSFVDPYSRVLNDVSVLLAPWELEVRRELAAGRLPLWSDLRDGGSSPWADPQVSVLSPTSMLARLLPAEHHFLAALALKIGVALVGAWVLARRLGARRPAALLGATAFALGGGILAWGLFPHSSATAWAPWCLAAAHRLARRSDGRTHLAAVAAIALLLLSGQPEVAFGVGALSGLVAVCVARRRRRSRALGRLAVAGALGFGLAAPMVVPFLAVVGESQRAHDRRVELGLVPGREPPEHPDRRADPRLLLAPLSPWMAGVPFDRPRPGARPLLAYSLYAGLVPLAGVAAALAAAKTRRRQAARLLALAVAVIVAGASLPPLSWWWRTLPLLRLQELSRLLPLATLALCMAGALGLDRLLRDRGGARALRHALLVAAAMVCAWAVAPSPDVAGLGLVLVLAVPLAARAPRAAFAALAIAALVDQVRWGRHLLPPGDPRAFYPRTADVEALVHEAGGPGGRAVGHDRLLYPALLSTYGLSDPRPHNPLASRAYLEVLSAAFGFAPDMWHYFAAFRTPEHPLLDFLGVRVVYSNGSLPRIPGMQRRPLSNPHTFLALNRDALSRHFLAQRFDLVERENLAEWIRKMEDPRRVALFRDEAEAVVPRRGYRAGRVRLLAWQPGEIELRLPRAGTKLLATSHRGPRGWRARAADGERLRTLTVNGAFLGVVVPPGVDRVSLEYRPPGYLLGAGLAAASAAALALAWRPPRRAARG